MTTTRKYYDSLINAFTRINNSNVNEPKEYFEAKSELTHLISRILKFDLFPLTFTNDFFGLLESESIKDFDNQKIKIVNELHFELIECLWTTRLRFGGELIQYLSKIKIALLNLDIKEIELFEKIKTEPITEAMPSDIFEFRIHSYFTTNGDNSVKLHHQFYDFYPSYFHNLEEITDKFAGAHIASLKKEDFSFRNPFSIINIHQELVQIFIQNSNGQEIEEFCSFLLKCKGYKIVELLLSKNIRFDISATKEKKYFSFEIFHHKSRSVANIKARINLLNKTSSKIIPTFIFTSFPGAEVYK